jgi:3,4-dihydroxy-2-butanone 4-phosphate synthase
MTELVDPMEIQLMLDQNQSDGKKRHSDQTHFAVTVEIAAQKAAIEVSAQNQELVAEDLVFVTARKHHRSSPDQVHTLAGTDETTNTCMVYKDGDNDAVVEQRRKAKKRMMRLSSVR